MRLIVIPIHISFSFIVLSITLSPRLFVYPLYITNIADTITIIIAINTKAKYGSTRLDITPS